MSHTSAPFKLRQQAWLVITLAILVGAVATVWCGMLEGFGSSAILCGAIGSLSTVLVWRMVLHSIQRRARIGELVEELQLSEERLRAIVESQTEMICRATPDWTVEFVNEAYCEFFGVALEDQIGRSFAPIVHPEDQEKVGLLLGSLCPEHPVVEIENRVIRADGECRWSRWTVRAILDESGVVHAMQGVGSDITEQRRAQERVVESERRFDLAVQGSTDGLWDWNVQTGEVYYAPRFKELLGYDVSEFPDEFDSFERALHEEDRGATLEAIEHHLDLGSTYDVRYRLRCKDGEYRWFRARGAAQRDAKGEPFRMAGSIVDITAEKDAEARLQRFNAELLKAKHILEEQARELALKTEELERARTLAESANQSKSDFLTNMSHEIRTPMTAIMGYAELLYDTAQGEEERDRCIETIQRNGEHLLTILNDILDLSKIEAGAMTIEHIACDPREIATEVCELLRPRAEGKGLCLELLVDGPMPREIRSDPTRLRQILINLVGNAIKFTESGGVWVLMKTARPDEAPESLRLFFEVIDTGIGLSDEQSGRLFLPFSQADDSTTRRFGGTGLGLAISRRLAGMLGGAIEVGSIDNGGSTFRVWIDAGRRDELEFVERQGEHWARHRPRQGVDQTLVLTGRILLAEDGPDNQRLLRFILRKAGAVVDLAENGRDAVEAALTAMREGRPYDLILMDMQMPVLDGYGATRQLRASGYAGSIVGLTAHSRSGDREKVIDAGCDEYLVKPVARRQLLELCAEFMTTPSGRRAA